MVTSSEISANVSARIGRQPVILLLALGLVLAACSDSVGPVPAGDYSSRDYAWTGSGTLDYVRSAQGTDVRHSLQFSGGGILDQSRSASGSLLAETPLSLVDASGEIRLTGCGVSSLFHIPGDMRFEDRVTSVPGPTVSAECWLTYDTETLLAGDADGGLARYRTRTNEWVAEDVPWSSRITAMDIDSSTGQRRLLVATSAEGIFTRFAGDSGWISLNAPAGYVNDIDADNDGTIFAVVDNELYEYRVSVNGWRPFTITSVASNVTGISILPVSPFESVLFIARSIGGLAQVYLLSSFPAQVALSERFAQEVITDVRTSPRSGYSAVAVANPAMLYVALQGGTMWVSVPVSSPHTLTAVSQSDRSGTILIGTENGLMRFDGAPPEASGLAGKHILSLHYGPDGAFYCGTTTGSYRSVDEGRIWTRIDQGSILVREATGLTLLPSRFSVGSSWDAASTIVQGSGAVTLRGRVLEHFDELILPGDRGRYDDVMVVRYARELPDGTRVPGSYAWTVYYARGKGPVYFEETVDNDVRATAWITLP